MNKTTDSTISELGFLIYSNTHRKMARDLFEIEEKFDQVAGRDVQSSLMRLRMEVHKVIGPAWIMRDAQLKDING